MRVTTDAQGCASGPDGWLFTDLLPNTEYDVGYCDGRGAYAEAASETWRENVAEAASDIFDSWATIAIFAVPIALVGGLVGAIAAVRWRDRG